MKETAKIVETAKQVAEVLVNHRITYVEVNWVFRETERHLALATNPETTRTRAPYSRFPVESVPESDAESIRAWREQTGWRRFQTTFKDMDEFKEMRDTISKHDLTQRELAVIAATIRIAPGFTLADFHQDDTE